MPPDTCSAYQVPSLTLREVHQYRSGSKSDETQIHNIWLSKIRVCIYIYTIPATCRMGEWQGMFVHRAYEGGDS
jgi:hypothetical protein